MQAPAAAAGRRPSPFSGPASARRLVARMPRVRGSGAIVSEPLREERAFDVVECATRRASVPHARCDLCAAGRAAAGDAGTGRGAREGGGAAGRRVARVADRGGHLVARRARGRAAAGPGRSARHARPRDQHLRASPLRSGRRGRRGLRGDQSSRPVAIGPGRARAGPGGRRGDGGDHGQGRRWTRRGRARPPHGRPGSLRLSYRELHDGPGRAGVAGRGHRARR